MKNITRRSWDIIPMPDTVIGRVNILGKYQLEILVFTDRKGRLIGDGDVNLTGVDRDENEAQLQIQNKNDPNYQEDQEKVRTEQEEQTIQQPIKVELESLE